MQNCELAKKYQVSPLTRK